MGTFLCSGPNFARAQDAAAPNGDRHLLD